MRSQRWKCAFILLLAAGAVCLQRASSGQAKQDAGRKESVKALFERVAKQLDCIPFGEVLIDRFDERGYAVPPSMMRKCSVLIPQFMDPTLPREQIVPLLHHPDPRVRGLAIAAVFAFDDEKLLPQIAALRGDTARTIPQPESAGALPPPPDIETRPAQLGPVTVGEVAEAAVRWYTAIGGVKDYDAFLKVYGEREFSVAFFSVWMTRATQYTEGGRPGREPYVRNVRKRIDQLPEPDRSWMLIAFPEYLGLSTQDECVAAAQSLGHATLVDILHDIPRYEDPGLLPSTGFQPSQRFKFMQSFIIKRAKRLLIPEDAPYLAAKGEILWSVAAAELDPQQGSEWLKFGIEGYGKSYNADTFGLLPRTLWQFYGLTEKRYLTDWCYREMPAPGKKQPGAQGYCLKALAKNEPQNREMLAALLTDPRANTLDWTALQAMGEIINSWTTRPVIDPNALAGYFPFPNQFLYYRSPQEERAKYPDIGPRLDSTILDWRKRLQASVLLWR